MDQVIIYVKDGVESTHIGTVSGLYTLEPTAQLVTILPLTLDGQGELINKREKMALNTK